MKPATATDAALLNLMAEDLERAGVDLGDETQIALALVGRYEPRLIDHMLDTVIEAARVMRAHRLTMPEGDFVAQLCAAASAEQEADHGGL